MYMSVGYSYSVIVFFNDTATTEIYTLSLHDALPIYPGRNPAARLRRPARPAAHSRRHRAGGQRRAGRRLHRQVRQDRKSTRLNSSHANISYAVFCLKKKKTKYSHMHTQPIYIHTNYI